MFPMAVGLKKGSDITKGDITEGDITEVRVYALSRRLIVHLENRTSVMVKMHLCCAKATSSSCYNFPCETTSSSCYNSPYETTRAVKEEAVTIKCSRGQSLGLAVTYPEGSACAKMGVEFPFHVR
jgi:hypothetical protein